MTEAWKQRGPDFNAWNLNFHKFAALLDSVRDEPWWIKNFDLKYLNIRLDTRDNGFILLSDEKDGKRERVSVEKVVDTIDKYLSDFTSRKPVVTSAEAMVEQLMKPSDTEATMEAWDGLRAYLLDGGMGTYARDIFEGILSNIDTEREEAADLISKLEDERRDAVAEATTWEKKWVDQNAYNDHLIAENNRLRADLAKLEAGK